MSVGKSDGERVNAPLGYTFIINDYVKQTNCLITYAKITQVILYIAIRVTLPASLLWASGWCPLWW